MYLISTKGLRGPADPTSHAIPRFSENGLQDSPILIDDDGNLDAQGGSLSNISTASYSGWPELVPTAGEATLEFDEYQAASVVLNAPDVLLSLSEPRGPGAFKLIVTQDAVGGRTVTWSSGLDILAPYGAIFLAGDPLSESLLGLIYTGSKWYIVSSQPMLTIF